MTKPAESVLKYTARETSTTSRAQRKMWARFGVSAGTVTGWGVSSITR
ncbi:MAG: hypothetical protein ACYTAN_16435 [Planctomycetota bacterium]